MQSTWVPSFRGQPRRVIVVTSVGLAIGLTLAASCTTTSDKRSPDPRPPTKAPAPKSEGEQKHAKAPAKSATNASAVEQLSAEYWEYLMRASPQWATQSGDHRFDDLLGDTGPKSIAMQQAKEQELLSKARSITGDVSAADQISLALLIEELERNLEAGQLGFATFDVHQMYGPQAMLPDFMTRQHPMKTKADVENLIARYRAVPAYLQGHIDNLREGLGKGRVAPRVVVDRVIGQLDRLLAKVALEKSAFGKAVERIPNTLDPAVKAELRATILEETQKSVLAGFESYRRFLVDEYQAKARTTVGLGDMPGGKAAYAHLVRRHTTTAMTPDEIHQVGLDELARIEAKIAALAKERGFDGDVPTFLKSLRAERAQYADSREALLKSFRSALDRADKALPSAFGRLPKLPYKVEPLDASRERDAPAAYYQPGAPDDGRAGVFAANLYRFEERPLFNSDVLAFHEAVPGHHLQIALAQELDDIPQFRSESYNTAFVEGWALYSERLSDELGLYHDLESRVGYLGFAAWRASRLVVDTGLHAKGWTRQEAIDFLAAHTTLGKIDVENEIDRYIAMPGQALAYMIGCLHILSLREHVRASLGDAFSLPAFHDAVLGEGALPLSVLDAQVTAKLGVPARSPAAQTRGIMAP